MTLPIVSAATVLAALVLAGCNGSAQDAATSPPQSGSTTSGRSTATITQGDENGTTTTTRSTDGAQTITRKNGGNSATVTQSP